MRLREAEQRTAEPQNIEYRISNIECRMSKDGIASLTLFFRWTEYINSMFISFFFDQTGRSGGQRLS